MYQNLLFKKESFKRLYSIHETVRIIPVSGNYEIIVSSDREIGRIWENYRTSQGNFHSQNAAIFQRNGTGCPVRGYTV